MDVLALEAKNVQGAEPEKKAAPRPKPKPPKKAKRIVYFEVEIIDLRTKEKLLLLDKVSVNGLFNYWHFTLAIRIKNLRGYLLESVHVKVVQSVQERVANITLYRPQVESFFKFTVVKPKETYLS